ncbi:prostamide/prostaglandin F synthase-like [Sinocyclocheilus rhinocerous]|uniref:prostamide/prostaglandin F synthase-like n=1 Tax=Sinocyclocheilus rhinocerous TaxID=307959 RepID=UPI0007BAB86E|nr:PREDICTED: prostamide/prostaglandin F synthase-like [Sinocyclocheilus rhinocerous]
MSSVNLTSLGANQVKNTTSGEMVEIGSLWREQTVILFFLRRFGCQVCRWMAAEVSKLEKNLKANGVALIGIGPEETGVKEFKDGGFFKGDIYIDEKKQCYNDLGFKRYNAVNVIPAAMGKSVREIASKASAEGIHGNFSGDLLQSGGMLIVTKELFIPQQYTHGSSGGADASYGKGDASLGSAGVRAPTTTAELTHCATPTAGSLYIYRHRASA